MLKKFDFECRGTSRLIFLAFPFHQESSDIGKVNDFKISKFACVAGGSDIERGNQVCSYEET